MAVSRPIVGYRKLFTYLQCVTLSSKGLDKQSISRLCEECYDVAISLSNITHQIEIASSSCEVAGFLAKTQIIITYKNIII